jgi:octaprenyl-diphosphate synthase
MPVPSTSPPTADLTGQQAWDSVFSMIAEDLEHVEDILRRELRSQFAVVQRVLNHIGRYRGKRLRPALLLLAARMCGPIRPEHHLLAAVVEMIHTATLIHDDVLDGARLRRHLPTVHHEWGVPAAVLAGDFLFSHAFTLASQTGSTLACRLIGQATNRVCEGEMYQTLQQGRLDLEEEEYLAIIRGKTAELTSVACRLGAEFADATNEQTEALAQFGLHLGLAFQITDDLLDLFGDEQLTGKSLGTDWLQRKATLPVIYHSNSLPPQERPHFIRSCLDDRLPLSQLRKLLEQSGALAQAWRRAEHEAQLARKALSLFPASPERSACDTLVQLCLYRYA